MTSNESLNVSEPIRTQVPPAAAATAAAVAVAATAVAVGSLSAAPDNGVSKFRSPLLRQMMEGKLAKTAGFRSEPSETLPNQNTASSAASQEDVREAESNTLKLASNFPVSGADTSTRNEVALSGKRSVVDEDKDIDESDLDGLYMRSLQPVKCNGDDFDTTKTSIPDSTGQFPANCEMWTADTS
jgi:hypothetical protein